MMNPKPHHRRDTQIESERFYFAFCLRIDRSKTNKIVTSHNLYLIKAVSFYSFQYQQCTL